MFFYFSQALSASIWVKSITAFHKLPGCARHGGMVQRKLYIFKCVVFMVDMDWGRQLNITSFPPNKLDVNEISRDIREYVTDSLKSVFNCVCL